MRGWLAVRYEDYPYTRVSCSLAGGVLNTYLLSQFWTGLTRFPRFQDTSKTR